MDPCNVCGGTDMNLVDGFYYCVECGTQDMNVRETVVEQTVMGDGTYAHTTSRRFTTVVKEGIEMSNEWHKWHIFNFILVGLTDELIALGAKPSVKMKVLWIWSRYVKQFQIKDDLQSKHTLGIEEDDNTLKGECNNENDKEDSCNEDSDPMSRLHKSTNKKSDKIVRDIKTITKGTILTILYVALNLDRSDIQLSHLFRFIREGRLSLYDCMKYVPKELKLNAVKNWKSFILSIIEYNPISIRELSLTCFKILKLGVPLVPDLRKIVRNFVQELCLPSDIQELVFALMHFIPIDFLHINAKIQKSLVRIPDYEGICMGYVLVALKMCFGLDDDYELRISKEVDKINNEENYLKSYNLGFLSEPCERLFSFKEWCQHLQFRKHMLCKNYLPMSRQFNNQTDDYIFMEHLEKRWKRDVKLSDEVTMDILNKIISDEEPNIIRKTDFPVTLTPMSTYLEIISQSVQNPDLKLLLCEDFTQYSLKYAINDFTLPVTVCGIDNPIVGVCESGKIFNKHVIGTLTVQEGDMAMVYVRDCQNKNWLKTEPPKMNHVTKTGQYENSSDKESDHGYDSNIENSNPESDATNLTSSDKTICEDDKILKIVDSLDINIFDDDFRDLFSVPSNNSQIAIKEERADNFEIDIYNNSGMADNTVNSLDRIVDLQERNLSEQFDPNIFDRDKIIKELIERACKMYKISIPKTDTERKQNKRKINLVDDKALSSELKRPRTINRSLPGEAKKTIDNFVSAYYNSLHNDILKEVSQQVKHIIEDVDNLNNRDISTVLDNQRLLNNSFITNNESNVNNVNVSHLTEEENAILHEEINITDSMRENNQDMINADEQSQNSITVDENIEDETFQELLPKNDPKYDEKEYDIRQLYLKLGEDNDVSNVWISDISNDPEIDKIILTQMEKFSNNDKNALTMTKTDRIDEFDNYSDSDDDIPLSIIKETRCFEQEKKERRKEKLEPFISDPSVIKIFKYWVRHYKSVYVVKSRDIGKKFDSELNKNLPISFFFVLRECAAILGYSMFSLYKNMQTIEEILIANG